MSAAKFHIYRNLRTGGFSIRRRGLVVDRDNFFIAENVEFRISEKGRQRVIKEKQKNVHAFVVSDKYSYCEWATIFDKTRPISYNPYTAAHFVCNGKRIDFARRVLFNSGKCYLIEE